MSARPQLRRLLREAAWILILTLVLAALSWLIRTPRLPLLADESEYVMDLDFDLLPVETCLRLYEEGAHIFIDTRSSAAEHIPGAIVIGLDTFDEDLSEVIDFIYPDDLLLLYGGEGPVAVAAVAARFEARGYQVAGIMRGGLRRWQQAGGEITGGEAP